MGDALRGRVAIVTGASRGIGAACALALARDGARVVLAARSAEALAQVAKEAGAAGGEAHAVTTDVSRLEDLERLVTETRGRFGGVDILVNNAGVLPPARQIYKVPVEEWDYTLNVNLKSAWYLSKLVHPLMRERGGGSIVNVSSTSGLHHDIGLGVYGVAKAALVMLTTVCAKEWARDRIRVNCVAPGVVRTEMAEPLIKYLEEHGQPPNPLKVIGEPEEVAALVRYLVSDEARYITGDVIRIDGGELL